MEPAYIKVMTTEEKFKAQERLERELALERLQMRKER